MDFLNKAFLQLKDLFRSMTAGARITAALLLVMVVVSLTYLFRYQMSGPDGYLMNGEVFSLQEQHNMEAAFGKENLKGWSWEGPHLRIPRGQQSVYMAALAKNNALPEYSGEAVRKALESTTILMDSQHRNQLLKAAKEREFGKRIRLMPNIQDACVMYDTETRRGLSNETIATASVTVTPKGSQPLTPAEARSISNLVAAGVVGLKPENVKVVDLSHPDRSFGDAGSGDPAADELAAKTQMWEKSKKEQIQQQLAHIRGLLVSVNVQLDPIKSVHERESKVDPKGTPITSVTKSKTRTQDGTVPAGAAGAIANQSLGPRPTTGKGSHQEEDESFEQAVNAVSSRSTEKNVSGHTLKRVMASIGVPSSYFENVWRMRQGTGAGTESKKPPQAELDQIRTQEITKIRESIAPLLLPPDGETDPTKIDMTRLVSVTEFPDIPLEQVPEPGLMEKTTGWLTEHWTTLGLIVLALASLLMLRSMLRSVPATEEPVRAPIAQGASQPAAETAREETAADRRLKRLSGSGPSLRDELSQMVSEDPEGSANILRTWIGNVS